ncbi:oligosaccharide flippase family protein [Luteimonas sp. gir]|uniref:lipopolysaccharide biosynthesis protein n=1 Tax=Luteimonas sp. gir TaxID=3127960 RepID=UPI003075C436
MLFEKVKRVLGRLAEGDASQVFKGMLTLVAGAGAARLIGLASIPLLSRIYSPEDFGVLSIYAALIAILAPTLTLRYALAIPLPRHDSTALNIFRLSLALIFVNASLLTCVLCLFAPELLRLLSMESLVPWWWMIALGAAGSATYELLTMWAARRRSYRIIARTQFVQSAIGETVKITLGLMGAKPLGLLFGHMFAQAGGITSLARSFRQDIPLGRLLAPRKGQLRKVAALYSDYPSFRLASQVLMIFAVQAPVMLMAAFYDAGSAGQLGLATMAVTLPANLLGESMAKAYYAEISAIGSKNPGRIRKLTFQVIKRLLVLSAPPTLVLFFSGPYLFPWILGPEWETAGTFISILSIYLVFQFIQKPVSYLMFVFKEQRSLLYLNIQRAIVTVLCFWAGHAMGLAATETLLIYAIAMSCHYALSVLVAVRKIPASD